MQWLSAADISRFHQKYLETLSPIAIISTSSRRQKTPKPKPPVCQFYTRALSNETSPASDLEAIVTSYRKL